MGGLGPIKHLRLHAEIPLAWLAYVPFVVLKSRPEHEAREIPKQQLSREMSHDARTQAHQFENNHLNGAIPHDPACYVLDQSREI